ncbi:MAG: hypothetical protein Q7K55_02435 [Candidatus Levybacteria bacterium]|nr:hypothetical protein [Candidatus Levybacteria bacterium]
MKRIIFYTIKGIEYLLRAGYLLAAVVIIFLSAYYFGNGLLFGLKGGDTANNLSIIHWFNNWYPRIPLWYPLQGGGVSLLYGYHFLAHFDTVVLHKITGLTLENSYQLLGFLSVPLTSLGIYFFVWTRLKNQTVALIASFFYFLSPITWVWLFDWGFYGESISYLFIPPALIFFDLFISSVFKRKFDFKFRVWLLLGAIFLVLLWFTHALSFLGIILFFPFYGILYPLVSSKTLRLKNTIYAIFLMFVFLAATYFLGAFHEINFQYYSLQSKNAGSTSKEFFFKDASEWYFKPFLNLEEIPITNRRFAEKNVSFAVPIWFLAIIGLIISFWFSKKLFVIGIFSALNFLFIFYYGPVWKFLNLTGAQHYRPLIIPLRIFLPILAAYGVLAVPHLFWSLVFLWRRRLKGNLSQIILNFQSLLVAISTIVLAIMIIMLFRYYSYLKPPSVRYGPNSIDFTMVDDERWPYLCPSKENPFKPNICNVPKKEKVQKSNLLTLCESKRIENNSSSISDFCKKDTSEKSLEELVKKCDEGTIEKNNIIYCNAVVQSFPKKLSFQNWPKPKIQGDASMFVPGIYKDYLDIKGKEEMVRVDISPNLGGLTQSFNLNNFSDSMINLWGYQSSLNHSYWGNQQYTFYGKGRTSAARYNVAKWFGTQYVLINSDADPVENFKQDTKNWEMVNPGIFRFKQNIGLYSFSTSKPLALVIGSEKLTAYETFFKLANEGVLSYDDAFMIMGKNNIDDYSLKELKDFNILVLFGYSYKNQKKAFKLLDTYVKEGGKLYISTGWQYSDKDWKINKAPDFFPVNDLSWSINLSKDLEYELKDQSFLDVNVSKFSPLAWGNQPWGVSIPSSTRSWAKIILTVSGKPLVVAGEYGSGKVVWSGINWMGHISSYNNNAEEIKFLKTVFKYLLPGNIKDESKETDAVVIKRDFPDKIEFTFKKDFEHGNFYLRESFHPDWKAHLKTQQGKTELQIYKSGPLYKLVKIPSVSSGDKLIFEYSNRIRGVIANIISFITLIFLLTYLFLGKKFLKIFIDPYFKFQGKMKKHITVKVSKLADKSKDEEEY